jgi:RIP metalloprotease RseP
MVETIKSSPDQTLKLQRERDQLLEVISMTPLNQQGQGRIGAQLQMNLSGEARTAANPGELMSYTLGEFQNLLQQTVAGYGGLITNFRATASQVSGPVKIVEMGAQLSEQGGSGLVLFMALISINLAVLNALPLPLLDGGQMLLLVIEAIRGRPVPERLQLAVAQSGFLLIVGLTLVLIVRDTSQLSVVQQMMGGR